MKPELNEMLDYLKSQNIRITSQRTAVLDYLLTHKTHPTADEIYQALDGQFESMSVATVYNNLRLFSQLGLLEEIKYGDSSSRFDLNRKPHYHAICSNCGKIEDFYYPGLGDVEIAAKQLTGYQVTKHRLEVYGLCPTCQKEKESKK